MGDVAAGHTRRWNSLELIRGTYGPDYLTADSIDIMFEKTTLLKVSDLQL